MRSSACEGHRDLQWPTQHHEVVGADSRGRDLLGLKVPDPRPPLLASSGASRTVLHCREALVLATTQDAKHYFKMGQGMFATQSTQDRAVACDSADLQGGPALGAYSCSPEAYSVQGHRSPLRIMQSQTRWWMLKKKHTNPW